MTRAVHQFHQGIRRGDAIGEEMLALRRILTGAGYDSEIFVGEEIPEDLKEEVRPFETYRGDSTHLLLAHHSIGHHYAGLLAALPDRKVLVYHNITPSRFFAGNPFMQGYLDRGRWQLRFLRDHVVGAFADSKYNAAELVRKGLVDVEVLPPVFAIGRLSTKRAAAASRRIDGTRILFVGRLSVSKRQEDVIEAFELYSARYDPTATLTLVGASDPNDPYARMIEKRIADSPISHRIERPGLVSDRELAALFSRASLYLSMSEHEGFGVPLLESFAAGVPVVAFRCGAVADTMGGAGLLFSVKQMDEVAALMAEVVFDAAFRTSIIEKQRERLRRPDVAEAPARFLAAVNRWIAPARRLTIVPSEKRRLEIRVDGPFETNYGLAVANRRLAQALANHTLHRVSIHCTEGPGDYLPRAADLEDKPLPRRLWERSFTTRHPDVAIRNLYPPRFERGAAKLQLGYFFWEDSLLPAGWAEEFNAWYDGILAPSSFVRDVLRRSGVTIPIEIVPSVVKLDPVAKETSPYPIKSRKKTRFLCVGSAFPRKGVDVLIHAFARAFRRSDDVVLVLKTIPNVHNTVASQLAELRQSDPDAPEVEHIDRDIEPRDLLDLYRSADALVHPSRAEGFGFPVAEAMLLGVPVIAPSSTGLADFCTSHTALVIPHRWEPSRSHFQISGAEWAEPDEDGLVDILRGFVGGQLRDEAIRRAAHAREFVAERFSPQAVARAAEAAIESMFSRKVAPVSVGYLSTWNARCGIATYTRNLIEGLPPGAADVCTFGNADVLRLAPDGEEVARVWVQGAGNYSRVVNEALERDVDVVHVQFHPGLFTEYHELSRTIHRLCDHGIAVFVTVHLAIDEAFFYSRRMVLPDLLSAFARCESIFVHNERDLHRLERFGFEKVEKIVHGGVVFPPRDRAALAKELGLADKRIVASFGFALPHKGVLESIEAVGLLRPRFPNIVFLALAAARSETISAEYLERCRRRIAELELDPVVFLMHQFLAEDEIATLLGAAEVVVLPYGPTLESASGAVRYPLACGRATITTREKIFEDVKDVVYRIPNAVPQTIAGAIEKILGDTAIRHELERKAWRFSVRHSWSELAGAHLVSYRNAIRTMRRDAVRA
jgi:glycosyltransferase involved in cell wall biosynthesis